MWFSLMRAANADFYVAEMGHDSRTQAARSSRWAGMTRLVGAVVIVASGLTFSAPPAAAQTPAASARPVVSVDLGAAGFTPSTVIAVPGQQIEFTNTSGADQRIIGGSTTAPTFDSGPIPDGGRFVAAFDKEVQIGIQTTADPPLTGRLLITEPGLLGDRAAPARPAIPNLAPPPTLASDLSPHPDYGRADEPNQTPGAADRHGDDRPGQRCGRRGRRLDRRRNAATAHDRSGDRRHRRLHRMVGRARQPAGRSRASRTSRRSGRSAST